MNAFTVDHHPDGYDKLPPKLQAFYDRRISPYITHGIHRCFLTSVSDGEALGITLQSRVGPYVLSTTEVVSLASFDLLPPSFLGDSMRLRYGLLASAEATARARIGLGLVKDDFPIADYPEYYDAEGRFTAGGSAK